MNEHIYFETENLYLYPTTEEDSEFIFELMNTPKWIQNIGDRDIKTIDDATTYIVERMKPQQERLGYSNYTVIRKNDLTKLGTCGLYSREKMNGVDIGFAFLPEHEGKGYASEASHALIAAAFEEFNLNEIHGYTSTDNLSSQRLLKRLGLIEIGLTEFPSTNEKLLKFTIKKP